MKKVEIKAFAKINLSLDVLGKRADGYHEVEMIMQQIMLHDLIMVSLEEGEGIAIDPGSEELPKDEGNLAYMAARIMLEQYGKKTYPSKGEEKCKQVNSAENRTKCNEGKIVIKVQKNIPLAAGLAGGSADGAAVILALNHLWGLNLSLEEMKRVAEILGQDVVFALVGQAYGNEILGFREKNEASPCALATGTGTQLSPLPGLEAFVVLSKVEHGVSTKEVYEGIDKVDICKRPDSHRIAEFLSSKKGRALVAEVAPFMANVMEEYTLNNYPKVAATKEAMQALTKRGKTLMSGSGPTIFMITNDEKEALSAYEAMCKKNKETFLTKTLV